MDVLILPVDGSIYWGALCNGSISLCIVRCFALESSIVEGAAPIATLTFEGVVRFLAMSLDLRPLCCMAWQISSSMISSLGCHARLHLGKLCQVGWGLFLVCPRLHGFDFGFIGGRFGFPLLSPSNVRIRSLPGENVPSKVFVPSPILRCSSLLSLPPYLSSIPILPSDPSPTRHSPPSSSRTGWGRGEPSFLPVLLPF